jgi:hypothetical protein
VPKNSRRKRVEAPVACIWKARRSLSNGAPASGLQGRACNGPGGVQDEVVQLAKKEILNIASLFVVLVLSTSA